jgi:hypothetical protein
MEGFEQKEMSVGMKEDSHGKPRGVESCGFRLHFSVESCENN